MAQGATLKDKIYTAVFKGIIKGEYKPGEVLVEKNLVEKYMVSKSPVREALIELCNEGVLRSIPRFGYEIIKLTEKDVEDVLAFRKIVECGCLRQYWNVITDRDIEELESFINMICLTSEHADVFTHWDNNKKFHLMLCSFYKNQYAYKMLENALSVLTRAYAQFHWDRWRRVVYKSNITAHIRIVENLKERNVEKTVEAIKSDIGVFDDMVL